MSRYTKETMLVIGTVHLPYVDYQRLSESVKHPEKNIYPFKILDQVDGFILHIPEKVLIGNHNALEYINQLGRKNTEVFLLKEFTDSFRSILRLAQQEGCHWIMFDADGTYYDNLPAFDW